MCNHPSKQVINLVHRNAHRTKYNIEKHSQTGCRPKANIHIFYFLGDAFFSLFARARKSRKSQVHFIASNASILNHFNMRRVNNIHNSLKPSKQCGISSMISIWIARFSLFLYFFSFSASFFLSALHFQIIRHQIFFELQKFHINCIQTICEWKFFPIFRLHSIFLPLRAHKISFQRKIRFKQNAMELFTISSDKINRKYSFKIDKTEKRAKDILKSKIESSNSIELLNVNNVAHNSFALEPGRLQVICHCCVLSEWLKMLALCVIR